MKFYDDLSLFGSLAAPALAATMAAPMCFVSSARDVYPLTKTNYSIPLDILSRNIGNYSQDYGTLLVQKKRLV